MGWRRAMRFENLNGKGANGLIDGAGNLVFAKNETPLYFTKCDGVRFQNWQIVSVRPRLHATWQALKFIWGKK